APPRRPPVRAGSRSASGSRPSPASSRRPAPRSRPSPSRRPVPPPGPAPTTARWRSSSCPPFVSFSSDATTLGARRAAVFSKRALSRTGVGADHAAGHHGEGGGGWIGGAVGGRRLAEGPFEARGEGADAGQADVEADLGDRAIGVAQQRRRPLEPSRQQVAVRGLA